MTISYESIISSPSFRFLVGPDKKPFTVHSALIAHHSEPLGALGNEALSEEKEGCASLEETDERTFVRFSQYAYTGDYIAAEPKPAPDSATAATHSTLSEALPKLAKGDVRKEETPVTDSIDSKPDPSPNDSIDSKPDPSPNDFDGWRSFSGSTKDKRGKKKIPSKMAPEKLESYEEERSFEKERLFEEIRPFHDLLESVKPASIPAQSKKSKLWDSFKNRAYPISQPTPDSRKACDPSENYNEFFVCHAKLYAFADEYGIAPLKSLSLHKLHKALAESTLHDERTDDVVELIRYSYSQTADLSESIDEMRLLVIHYVACVVEKLVKNTKFGSLLEQSGPLAKDLVEQMIKRLD